MDILQYNLPWMLYNSWLAILPVFFLQISLRLKYKPLKVFFLLLWFFYVPNTLYLLCDLTHLVQEWNLLHGVEKIILVIQYITLEACGFLTFFFSIVPFAQMLHHTKWKSYETHIIVCLNFLIGYAMVLGKVDRVNSWEVVTDPIHFINSSIHVVTYLPLLALTILFGLFANFLYFLAYPLFQKKK